MIADADQLDLATWPLILRPADVYIDRLNKTPWCPKCGKKTTWKARNEFGMCPSCHRLWASSSRIVQLSDVSPEQAAYIRRLNWEGRYSKRVKGSESMSLTKIAETISKDPHYKIEGKAWTIAVVAYVLAHKDFQPGPYLPVSTKPLWVHKSDRQSISYRCSHMDEVSQRIEHEKCRCTWGAYPCVCFCHQEAIAA